MNAKSTLWPTLKSSAYSCIKHLSGSFLYVFYLTIKEKSSDLGSIIPIVIDEEMGPREVK